MRDFLKTTKKGELRIIGLSFEKTRSEQEGLVNLRRLKDKLKINYPLVLASWNVKEKNVTQVIPELEKHLSYPTNLWLNQKGEVIYTHVGFSGPATQELYTNYKKEFHKTFEKFLKNP